MKFNHFNIFTRIFDIKISKYLTFYNKLDILKSFIIPYNELTISRHIFKHHKPVS